MDIKQEAKRQSEEIAQFDEFLRGARDTPWWRQFIEAVKRRRATFSETLECGVDDQRMEDRIRGQISELKWIIALDSYSHYKEEVKDARRDG